MINIIFILFMLLFLFKSYFCINIKNQIIMDGDKQKVNELTMRTLGSHYGGYAYVKVKNRQADVKIDWKLLRAIEEGEVEIDNEKYHLSGIEYVAKRYQDMFYAGRDIYYFKGIGGHGMTDLLRNAIDDLLDTISSREAYRSAEHRMYAQMNQLTEAGVECTPEECKLIDSLNRLAKKWEKDGKRLWLYSASGVLTVMMHGDREDNPIPEMLPNAGTNPDNIITTILGIGNDGGDW